MKKYLKKGMHFLDPIYHNNTGTAFALKSNTETDETFTKIQLQLGDIAILMDFNEIHSFLNTIKIARKGCNCPNCTQEGGYKVIKCDTAYAEVKLKATPKIMDGLEELINGVLFEKQISKLLGDNNIV